MKHAFATCLATMVFAAALRAAPPNIVVLFSDDAGYNDLDNGGAGGHDNAPLRGHKGQTYEGGIRVPFAIQWPAGIPAGQKSNAPVIALDVFATALAAAGIEKSPGKLIDGVNLLPMMTGKTMERPHQTLYWKTGGPWAVRDGDLKLVGGNTDQPATKIALFDLAADQAETNNLAATRPEDVTRLRALYAAWLATHQPTPWGQGSKRAGSSDEEISDAPAQPATPATGKNIPGKRKRAAKK